MDRPPLPARKAAHPVTATRVVRSGPASPSLTAPDQHRTLRLLKRGAVALTVLAAATLGALVATHPVGAATGAATGAAATAAGTKGVSPDGTSVTAADPFFDSSPGTSNQAMIDFAQTASLQSGGS